LLFGIIGVIGASTSPAWAMEVEPGFDLFMTTQTTQVDLSGFGLGIVPLTGDESFFGIPGVDTIVERLQHAGVPNMGDSAPVDIELVALSLVSIAPVQIELCLFDIHVVGGSTLLPQTPGSMTINRDSADGGSFSATLPVDAEIHFLPLSGDCPPDPIIQPFQDVFVSQGVWSHLPAFFSCFIPDLPSGGFFPGVDPDTMEKVLTVEQASFAIHSVFPCMMMPPSPSAVGGDFIPLDTTMVLVAGTQTIAAWMIPITVSAVGIAIVIARKFSKYQPE